MADRWDRLWEAFELASAEDADGRRRRIEALRDSAPDLADRLERMLASRDERGPLDDPPVVRPEAAGDPWIGRTLGPYTLEALLGRGGMGEVYLARQREPVEREVAVKLLREGLHREAFVARFEAERRTLARLRHPAIATIHDAGRTDEGLPYFVMERVRGEPITDHCDRLGLGVSDRLRLFVAVCEGVEHAHRRGVLHRDLKPSNILVEERDGHAYPKVIDFGIARVLHHDGADAGERPTRAGTIVGTPEYMSPEQADGVDADVDTRSDVYSLGVLLYELLTGSLPFDAAALRSVSPARLRGALEASHPPTPSRRVARDGSGSAPAASRRLRGDLDWIVMKAIDPDRERRYGSAGELAADIGRFLDDRPVSAKPPSFPYLAGKFVRRHRAAVGAATALALAVVVALTGVVVGLVRTRRALEETGRERRKATQVLAVLEDTLTSVNPVEARGRDTSLLEEILRGTEARIERELADQPEAAGDLHLTLARAYRGLGRPGEAERHAGRADALLSATIGPTSRNAMRARNLLATVSWERGDHDRAEAMHRRLLEQRLEAFGEDDEDTLTSMNNLAIALKNRGDARGAAELLERCLAGKRRTFGDDAESTLTTMSNLARAHEELGDLDRAESLLREIVRIETGRYGRDDARTLHSIDILGGALASAGDHDEAERLHREALGGMVALYGERHPTTLGSRYNLGKLLILAGRPGEAEVELQRVVAVVREEFGESHRYARLAAQHLARAICLQRGRFDEALAGFERVQRVSAAARGESDPDQAMLDLHHGECLLDAGRPARARLSAALTALEGFYGAESDRARRARELLEVAG